jgi:hypothetical protein
VAFSSSESLETSLKFETAVNVIIKTTMTPETTNLTLKKELNNSWTPGLIRAVVVVEENSLLKIGSLG